MIGLELLKHFVLDRVFKHVVVSFNDVIFLVAVALDKVLKDLPQQKEVQHVWIHYGDLEVLLTALLLLLLL